jgi:Ras family
MLTDTAGQEEYRGLWASSNLKSDAFLLVYDITNASSLDTLEHFASMIEMEVDERLDGGNVPPVKLVAGNKCDLQSQRVVKSAQGLDWARQRNCGFMETSAREMVNIEETFARTLVSRAVFPPVSEMKMLTCLAPISNCPPRRRGPTHSSKRRYTAYDRRSHNAVDTAQREAAHEDRSCGATAANEIPATREVLGQAPVLVMYLCFELKSRRCWTRPARPGPDAGTKGGWGF